ncbi:MAG TPA: adenylate/guanylate cyclase domain-containing protein [Ktedonosporobacter sp.]|nr:adenylate/guanylate cyclase domain-containing protein [Ktedonosporobacter sp.]
MPEERKLVTILFADVTESTALGDTLDPEDVRALMSRYYGHARQVVAEYGGTLEKFIGDAVMAVFGLPQAHGDDAERALAAALALHTAVTNDKVLGPSFQLRIGVNTGEVVATSASSSTNDTTAGSSTTSERGDFLVTGDAVNIAARLQQSALPGETLAGERTMNAARTAFMFEAARVIVVKGKRQPLRVFPLKGQRQVRQVSRPPLVGRRQDLLQLAVLQARVLEEQRPQLVSIVAPAGTGKSRLLEEFLGSLDPADGFQVATVRCQPYGQTLTYWPLRTLLTSFLGDEITRVRVIEIFRQGGYDPHASVRLADFVLTGLGIQKEASVERECIFGAWRFLIEIVARQAPRILVFEDLHWASDSLLDLVEYILSLHVQAPILFITLSRPELLDRRPNWGGGKQNFTSLALQPLTPAQTRTLVDQLIKEAPAATCDLIVERSGGNPFFALELVRGLSEQQMSDAPVDSSTLPDTVHAAVLARLDQLSAIERAVLQVASVTTRSFHAPTLYAILPEYSQQEIDTALDGLLARDFIVPGDVGGAVYTFRHILISNVTYGTLSRTERIRLHSKIAAWLEQTAGEHNDAYAELIAYHYYEAIRLARQSAVPLALPIEPENAIRSLKRAGALASHIGNFIEARAHLQHAIDIAPESAQPALYELLGDSMTWGQTAVEAYRKALALWRTDSAAAVNDPLTGARLLRKLLICYTRASLWYHYHLSLEDIASLITEARQLAQAAKNEYEQWRVCVANLFSYLLGNEEAIPTDEGEQRNVGLEAAAYFEQQGDWAAFSEALDAYAALSQAIGADEDALSASQRRLTAPDLPALERSDAIQMIARAYMNLGDFDNCIKVIETELAQLQPEQPLYLGEGISHAMLTAYICGRWSKVDELAPIVAQIAGQEQYDLEALWVIADGYYAMFFVAQAREDDAALESAVATLKRIYPDESYTGRTFLNAFLEDDPHRVHYMDQSNLSKYVMKTLMLYNEHGLAFPDLTKLDKYGNSLIKGFTTCYREIALALAANDDTWLAGAIDKAEEHHLIVHAAHMRIVLAQRTSDPTQLERARPILEQLGDRRALRKLEEVKSTLEKYTPSS